MKKTESGIGAKEGGQGKQEGVVLRPEQRREAIMRAQQSLKKADALLGATPAKTSAERHLTIARTKLTVWLKRLSLVGAIAAGQGGLYAGAERAGDALHEGAVTIGNAIGSLGDIKPIQIDFGAPEEINENAAPQTQEIPVPATGDNSILQITINDPGEGYEPDATVHEDANVSPEEREQQILQESALLIADELQSEGFFGHDHNVTEFTASVRDRLSAMGITGEGPVQQAQFRIRERYRQLIQERAEHDVEGALSMANKVNGAFGGIDTYALALEHNRADLAAGIASETLSSYRDQVREIRTDTQYADDPEQRTDELSHARRDLIRDVFSQTHPDQAIETVRHLSQDERHQLASAVDAEIASLEAEAASAGTEVPPTIAQQLARLRTERASL